MLIINSGIFEQDKDTAGLNNAIATSQYVHCRIELVRKENHCYFILNRLFLHRYGKDIYNWF